MKASKFTQAQIAFVLKQAEDAHRSVNCAGKPGSATRRVKAKLREDRLPPVRVNETWAMDFVHGHLATGRQLHVLTLVDTFSRFSPAVDPRFSYRGGCCCYP